MYPIVAYYIKSSYVIMWISKYVLLSHLCCHAEQSPQAVAETLRDAVTVINVIEESIASLRYIVEGVCIMLGTETKREHTGLTVDLAQQGST